MKRKIKFKLIFILMFSTQLSSHSLIKYDLQIEDSIEKKFTNLFLTSFKKNKSVVEIPVFEINEIKSIHNEKLRDGFLEYEESILSLPEKLKLIQDKKNNFFEVKWEDFQTKKVYQEDNICVYVIKLYLFYKNKNVDVVSFQVLRKNDMIGVVNIHGEIVDDVIESVPVSRYKN